jgi:hypothetical protein
MAVVIETNPIDGVGIFDLLSINVSTIPQVVATSAVGNKLGHIIYKEAQVSIRCSKLFSLSRGLEREERTKFCHKINSV